MTQELDYRDNGDLAFNGEVVGQWDSSPNGIHNFANVKGEKFGDYYSRAELSGAIRDFLVRDILPPESKRRTKPQTSMDNIFNVILVIAGLPAMLAFTFDIISFRFQWWEFWLPVFVVFGIFVAIEKNRKQKSEASPEYKAEIARQEAERQEQAERKATEKAVCEARRVENLVVYSAMCIPTGKCYVGQTTRGLEARKAKHYENAYKGSKECPLFYEALRQYPKRNWKWSIIGSAKSIDELNAMEINAIAKYSRHPRGYNWHPGGDISD